LYIHIGENIIVSDKKLVGIFNHATLLMSKDNEWITKQVDSINKTIAIDRRNNIIASYVSPFTVIKRTSLVEDFFWRRGNDKGL
jgi:hypothetical protein